MRPLAAQWADIAIPHPTVLGQATTPQRGMGRVMIAHTVMGGLGVMVEAIMGPMGPLAPLPPGMDMTPDYLLMLVALGVVIGVVVACSDTPRK